MKHSTIIHWQPIAKAVSRALSIKHYPFTASARRVGPATAKVLVPWQGFLHLPLAIHDFLFPPAKTRSLRENNRLYGFAGVVALATLPVLLQGCRLCDKAAAKG